MAVSCYIGVESKARKIKKAYIGIDGKARTIKKMYIGIDGKARLFYRALRVFTYETSAGETIDSITECGGYLFAKRGSSTSFTINRYAIPTLTKVTYTVNRYDKSEIAKATSNVIFSYGYHSNSSSTRSDLYAGSCSVEGTIIYGESLLSTASLNSMGAINNGGDCYILSGVNYNYSSWTSIYSYGRFLAKITDNLTHTVSSNGSSMPRLGSTAQRFAGSIWVAGGITSTTSSETPHSTFVSVDTSMTITTRENLLYPMAYGASAATKDYVYFIGGRSGSGEYVSDMDVSNAVRTYNADGTNFDLKYANKIVSALAFSSDEQAFITGGLIPNGYYYDEDHDKVREYLESGTYAFDNNTTRRTISTTPVLHNAGSRGSEKGSISIGDYAIQVGTRYGVKNSSGTTVYVGGFYVYKID